MRIFGNHSRYRGIRITVAAIMIFAMLCTGIASDIFGTVRVQAAGAPVKTIKFIKWTKLYEMPQKDFTGVLMTEWGGQYYFTNGDEWGIVEDRGSGWRLTNITVNPYIGTGDTFYTRDLMNVPYFHYGGTDGDNKNARKYIIEF